MTESFCPLSSAFFRIGGKTSFSNQRYKRKDEFGDKVYELRLENRPPITDDLLPDEVLRRRKAATGGAGFKMPLSEKQKEAKKGKAD